jgi:hypothetical protein
MGDDADDALEQRPTVMGTPVNPPDLQQQIDAANRARILHWAREFDQRLTMSEACGVERNGFLAGQFGRLQEWESVDDIPALARMAEEVAVAVRLSAREEL